MNSCSRIKDNTVHFRTSIVGTCGFVCGCLWRVNFWCQGLLQTNINMTNFTYMSYHYFWIQNYWFRTFVSNVCGCVRVSAVFPYSNVETFMHTAFIPDVYVTRSWPLNITPVYAFALLKLRRMRLVGAFETCWNSAWFIPRQNLSQVDHRFLEHNSNKFLGSFDE